MQIYSRDVFYVTTKNMDQSSKHYVYRKLLDGKKNLSPRILFIFNSGCNLP